MSSLPSELSLNVKPSFVPRRIEDLLYEVSEIVDPKEKVSKLNCFVDGLEQEMKKIDAFKRELPLCMLLLNDAILFLNEEVKKCVASSHEVRPLLEEFIPIVSLSGKEEVDHSVAKKEMEIKDKKDWLSSVQLWNANETSGEDRSVGFHKQTLKKTESRNFARALRTLPPLKAHAILPSRDGGSLMDQSSNPGLSLSTPVDEKPGSVASKSSSTRPISSSPISPPSNLRNGLHFSPQQLSCRKQRRCWSSELHRRFVNALQQLGGCQVATPKQIRELMQVDGLTNDEVKSHLQKYRLHSRRVPPCPANQSTGLGSLWTSPQESSRATSSQPDSPQGPFQLVGNTGGTSTTGGDSMEDDDSVKSEDYSWKYLISRSVSGKV